VEEDEDAEDHEVVAKDEVLALVVEDHPYRVVSMILPLEEQVSVEVVVLRLAQAWTTTFETM
jgi:hypothetical protein